MFRTGTAIAITASFMLTLFGCRDTPTTPTGGGDSVLGSNMLANGTFANSLTNSQDMYPGSVTGWEPGTGSPQICAGTGCGDQGFLQMWGNASVGESSSQILSKPILKGHTYVVTACVQFMNDNPLNYTPYAKARFVAFNSSAAGNGERLEQNPPQSSVIGWIRTDNTGWMTSSTAEWTADADYAGFSINAENETPDNNTPNTVSWIRIDNVQLQEKGQKAE